MGGPQRTVRETVARLSQEFPEDDREGLVARWEHEAGALQLLDDLKERLIDGQLMTQKEIADLMATAQQLRVTG